jgi:EmrB/QacA subfamily drug resistance transporter
MALARGWKVLAAASIAVFLVSLDVTIVNIAFTKIAEDFDSDRAQLSWVLSGYNIAFAACLLTAGRLADRFGRRRIFFTGLLVFTVSSALCGLAPSAGALIAARVLQAMGGALIMPASLALVLAEFPVERRSAAIGVWGAVGALSAAAGPLLGAALIDPVGWRGIFFVNTPACIVAYLFGRRLLVESRDPNAKGLPDVIGAFLATGAVALLVLGIVQGEEWGWTGGRTLASFAVGALVLVGFVVRCRVQDDPVLDLSLFGKRYFSVANGAGLLFSMGFFAMIFANVQFLIGVWGWSTTSAGLASAPGPLAAALVSAPAGRLADRYGHRVIVVPGTLLYAAGIGLIAWRVPLEPDYWATFFPASIVSGLGVGLTISTIGAAANAFLPPTRFAMGGAVNATLRQVGAALGIAAVVALLAEVGTAGTDVGAAFDRVYGFIALTSVAAAALMAALYRRPIASVDPSAIPSTVIAPAG